MQLYSKETSALVFSCEICEFLSTSANDCFYHNARIENCISTQLKSEIKYDKRNMAIPKNCQTVTLEQLHMTSIADFGVRIQ